MSISNAHCHSFGQNQTSKHATNINKLKGDKHMSGTTIHPSIHYLARFFLVTVIGGGVLEPIPACIAREAKIQAGEAANPLQVTHTIHPHTIPRGLDSANNLS